jgi:hypothetical protein
MILVVSSWPVQSCRVSLIGSFDSTSAKAVAESASETAATPPIAAVLMRSNIYRLPVCAFIAAPPQGPGIFRGASDAAGAPQGRIEAACDAQFKKKLSKLNKSP